MSPTSKQPHLMKSKPSIPTHVARLTKTALSLISHLQKSSLTSCRPRPRLSRSTLASNCCMSRMKTRKTYGTRRTSKKTYSPNLLKKKKNRALFSLIPVTKKNQKSDSIASASCSSLSKEQRSCPLSSTKWATIYSTRQDGTINLKVLPDTPNTLISNAPSLTQMQSGSRPNRRYLTQASQIEPMNRKCRPLDCLSSMKMKCRAKTMCWFNLRLSSLLF